MSARVTLALALSFALAGCGGPSVHLTVDGSPLDVSRVSGTVSSTTERTTIDLSVSDDGPPGVADAGVTYVFRIELAPGVAAGTALDVAGVATLDGSDLDVRSLVRAFTPDTGHDGRVLGVSATSQCFCGGVATHFTQNVGGHVDVVEAGGQMVLEVDLSFDGLVPGGFSRQRLHVVGRFTATPPAR